MKLAFWLRDLLTSDFTNLGKSQRCGFHLTMKMGASPDLRPKLLDFVVAQS